ncbi:hypothetical protein TVAG_495120 [Trichomonas vaginalis G3]|uniref:BAH domain-containing protein n=1 Tax=Trichomonas vaginalis (strain ATCC PRA-98 / G3) TaxID=412133 RepID=A2FWP7_TRIV3|nr:protein kinase protein [Trichomonas vaginalis G3]EAX90675.1 hypothetical protein TVAG_495120 [Trichomonas vaginalis G3]KAI5553985.1 protein kinase protein [Trichomonas vaginalis G3]|eukprot:XP_001303605.1 hypothetical protein [Trichomonas vaginalis G3]
MSQVQVAANVVKNGTRPLLPSSAPPKIAKMIKFCWDADPQRRPTMDSIAKAIASGGVVFPGTNMSDVLSYLGRFSEDPIVAEIQKFKESQISKTGSVSNLPKISPRQDSISNAQHSLVRGQRSQSISLIQSPVKRRQSYDPQNEASILALVESQNANQALIPGFMILLKGKEYANAVLEIARMCVHDEWCETIKNSEIPLMLSEILTRTDSLLMVEKIYSIFCRFISTGFNVPAIYHSIFSSFQKLGSTSLTDILVLIRSALENGIEPPASGVFMYKLAAFLQASNMNLRKQAAKIFLEMIQKASYIFHFAVAIDPAISNMIPGGEILTEVLQIIKILIEKGSLEKDFLNANGLNALLQLILPNDEIIEQIGRKDLELAFCILLSVCKMSISDDQLLQFVEFLPKSLTKLKSMDDLAEFVAISSFAFTKTKLSLVITTKYIDFIKSLYKVPDAKIVLMSLKLTYFYLQNDETKSYFFDSGREISMLMNTDCDAVSAIAASCMIYFYSSLSGKKYSKPLNRALKTFLSANLSEKSKLKVYALRLFGTISLTYEGADFLEIFNYPTQVKELINFLLFMSSVLLL